MTTLSTLFDFRDKKVEAIENSLKYIAILLDGKSNNAKKEFLPELLGVFDKIKEMPKASIHWCEVLHHFLENNDTALEAVEKNCLGPLTELSGSTDKDVAMAALKEIIIYANIVCARLKDKNPANQERIKKCTEIVLKFFSGTNSFNEQDIATFCGILEKDIATFCGILENFCSVPKNRDAICEKKGLKCLANVLIYGNKDDLIASALSALTKYSKATAPIHKEVAGLGVEKKVNELIQGKRCITQCYAFFQAFSSRQPGAEKMVKSSWPILISQLEEYNTMPDGDLECLVETLANIKTKAKSTPSFASHCNSLFAVSNAKIDTINTFIACMKLINAVPETEIDPKTSSFFLGVSVNGLEKHIHSNKPEVFAECFTCIRNNMKNNIQNINLEDTINKSLKELKDRHKGQSNFQVVFVKGILTLAKYATLGPQNNRRGIIEATITQIIRDNIDEPEISPFSAFLKLLDSSKGLTSEEIAIAESILVKAFDAGSDIPSLKQLIETRESHKNIGGAIAEIFNKCAESGNIEKLTAVISFDDCIGIAFENMDAPHFFKFVHTLMKNKNKRWLPESVISKIVDAIIGAKTTERYPEYIQLLCKTKLQKTCADLVVPCVDKITDYTCSAKASKINICGILDVKENELCLDLLRKLMNIGGKVCEKFIEIDGIKRVNDSIPSNATVPLIRLWLEVLEKIISSKTMKGDLMPLFEIIFGKMKSFNNDKVKVNGCRAINALVSTYQDMAKRIASDEFFGFISKNTNKENSNDLLAECKKLVETLLSNPQIKEKYAKYNHLPTEIKGIKKIPSRFSNNIFTEKSFTFKDVLAGVKSKPLPTLEEALREAKFKDHGEFASYCITKVQEKDEEDGSFSTLTDEEKGAIFAYTLEEYDKEVPIYKQMNRDMGCRTGGNFSKWGGYIYLLLSGLRKCADSYTGGVLYRGMSFKEDDVKKYKDAKERGEEKTWWSFVSTSTELKIANAFTERGDEDKRGVLFIIKNAKGCMLSKLSNEEEECEVLLEPERKFRVLEVVEFSEKTIIVIEITNPDYHLLDDV